MCPRKRGNSTAYTWGYVVTGLSASIALAESTTSFATNDPRAPIPLDRVPIAWPSSTSNGTPSHDEIAYRLASELRLVDSYRDNFVAFAGERMIDRYLQRRTSAELGEPLPRHRSPDDWLPELFALMTEEDQRQYLTERMSWVHALPPKRKLHFNTPLPGINAAERFAVLGDARSAAALLMGPFSKTRFLNSYEYSDNVISIVDPSRAESGDSTDERKSSLFRTSSPDRVVPYLPLYGELGLIDFSRNLQRQLAVQKNVEAWIAYHQYQQYALRFAQAKLTSDDARNLIPMYLGLPQDVRSALAGQVFTQSDHREILRALRDLDPVSDARRRLLLDLEVAEVGQLASFLIGPGYCESGAVSGISDEQVDTLADAVADDEELVEEDETEGHEVESMLSVLRTKNVLVAAKIVCDSITEAILSSALGKALAIGGENTYPTALFDKASAEFARTFMATFDSDDPGLSKVFTEPLAYAIVSLAAQFDQPVSDFLTSFSELSARDQEKSLLYYAQSSYSPDGQQSLGRLLFVVAELHAVSAGLSFVLSSIFSAIAIGLLTLAIGSIINRVFDARHLATERRCSDASTPDLEGYDRLERHSLIGRTELVRRIFKVAGTQRGTVGLSGDRGCGKSRILREVYVTEKNAGSVAVWMDCPAHYSQREFVRSLFDRVIAAVDSYAAHQLGRPSRAQSYWISISLRGDGTLGGILMLLTILLTVSISGRSDVDQFAWIPHVLFLLALPIVFGIDASRMLSLRHSEKRKLNDVQRRDLVYLTTRAREEHAQGIVRWPWFAIALIACGAAGVFLASIVAGATLAFLSIGSGIATIVLGIIAISIYVRVRVNSNDTSDRTTITLVARFRQFMIETAYRTFPDDQIDRSRGERGDRPLNNFGRREYPGVAVFIDEIDKIADIGEVRSFLREAKPLFDIPECRFYLSVARDVADKLYLRRKEGRDEVDSTIDHIELVGSLPEVDCKALLQSYLDDMGATRFRSDTEIAVVVMSRGNPRDLLRLADWVRFGYACTWIDLVVEEARRVLVSVTEDLRAAILRSLEEILKAEPDPDEWGTVLDHVEGSTKEVRGTVMEVLGIARKLSHMVREERR